MDCQLNSRAKFFKMLLEIQILISINIIIIPYCLVPNHPLGQVGGYVCDILTYGHPFPHTQSDMHEHTHIHVHTFVHTYHECKLDNTCLAF